MRAGSLASTVATASLLLAAAGASAAQRAPDVRALRPGQVIDDVVEDGDPVVETEALRLNYTDAPVVGKTYRVEVSETGTYHLDLRSCLFDAYVVARDGSGRVIAEDDDGLLVPNARLVIELEAGDEVRVEACALHGGRGGFELALHRGRPLELDASARRAAIIGERRRCVEALRQELGPAHVAVALGLYSLAAALQDDGDFAEARRSYEQALALEEELLGPEHPLVADCLYELGWVLTLLGDYAAAQPVVERTLALREKLLGSEHAAVADSLDDLGTLHVLMGDRSIARPLLERALAIRERVLGAEHPKVGTSLTSLGEVLRLQGDVAGARRLLERALAILERALGPQHLDVATALNNLGVVLQSQGDFEGQRDLLERALSIRESSLGPDHPDVAQSLVNLGRALHDLGDLRGAQPLFERALAIRERVFGPEHRDVVATLAFLASLDQTLGDYSSAESLYERSLAGYEKALGAEHPDVARALCSLASLLGAKGEFARARTLAERSLAIMERASGADHPEVAIVLHELATLDLAQGQYAAAEVLLRRALAIREQALGSEHPAIATTLSALAQSMKAQGDYGAARLFVDRTLALNEATRGPHHPEFARSLEGLASLLQVMGDYAGARPHFERALAVMEEALGPDHPDVAKCLNNLGVLLHEQGDFARARPLYERALAVRERALGPAHPFVATSLLNLSSLLQDQGDLAGARPLVERALAIEEAALAPEHPDVAFGLDHLARLLLAQGDPAGAELLFQRSLAIREAALGAEHPAVASTLGNIALTRSVQGDLVEARELYERSLKIREAALGFDHPEVAVVLNNLAVLLQAEGDLATAARTHERALAIREKVLGPDHPEVLASLGSLAIVDLRRGDLVAAIALLERAGRARTSHVLRLLGGASESELRQYFTTLAWQVELSQSQSLLPGRLTGAYEALLAWKGQILRAARASRTALRSKLDPEARTRADRLQQVSAALSRTSSGIERTVDPLDARALDALVRERQRLERELAPWTDRILPASPSWSEVRAALPPHAALVDVFIHRSFEPARREGESFVEARGWCEPRVSVWLTRAESSEPRHVDLGPVAAIEAVVRGALATLGNARGVSLAPTDDATAELTRMIWDPLAPHLDGIETVIVSPDGVLAAIPFEILTATQGTCLVESRGFVYLTDPTDLVRMAEPTVVAEPSLLALGDVDFDALDEREAPADEPPMMLAAALGHDEHPDGRPRGAAGTRWTRLAATGPEAERVLAVHAAAFSESERQLIVRRAATEDSLKSLAPRYSTLHLATHGYFASEGWLTIEDDEKAGLATESLTDVARRLEGYSPGLLSGLVCAGANTDLQPPRDDGYLTAEEVGWLDLSGCDLVVLSACDTGLGRAQSGEGLLGLRRAFLTAGARSVISSLWSVPDQETAELMGLFYENLWQKKLGKHESLRAAQLEMLARNRERFDGDARPVTWGAFVLDGDWR